MSRKYKMGNTSNACYRLACQRLVDRIEQLLQLVELQVRPQDLSLDVAYHLKRDVSPVFKRLCNWINSHGHPMALLFNIALEAKQLLKSCHPVAAGDRKDFLSCVR